MVHKNGHVVKRDLYLDRFIKLLEQTAARAHKDLERERSRIDFIEGKVERLELAVLNQKGEVGREFVERTDRATLPPARKKPDITDVRATPEKISFSVLRSKWESMSSAEQEEAVKKADLVIDQREKTASA
jgi:hypothetical protein